MESQLNDSGRETQATAQDVSSRAFGLPVEKPESVGMSAEKLAEIRPLMQSFVDKEKVAGLVTAVARDGKVVHFEAIGNMDVERGKAMLPDTIFRMYSMTKPITAAAIMMLVEEGKVRVSDPVSKYIPEFVDFKVLVENEDQSTRLEPAERPMTIKHLLMHTSGLTYNFIIGPVGKLYAENGLDGTRELDLSLEEFAIRAASFPLVAHPGTEWNYSISMDILGRVAEVVTGQRYGEFLAERIFNPLGMKDSGFHVPAEKAERFAANYRRNEETGNRELEDDPESSPYLKVPGLDSGGGGMVGTAADYLRFAQMLVNGGELDGTRVLSKASVDEMTTNHMGPEFGLAPLASIIPVGAKGVGFGYCGSVVMEGEEGTAFGSSGVYSWAGAASTDFWIDRSQKLVGMVLTQVMPSGRYPTRRVMHNATSDAIVERY
jgi:CubicO group peptidase (beta-lactamase class C family)